VYLSLLFLSSFLGGIRWIIGLGVVYLLSGSLIIYVVRKGLYAYSELYVEKEKWCLSELDEKRHSLQPFLIGVFERTFFTVLIAFEVPAVGAALILWITAKMIAGWSRYTKDTIKSRVWAFNALLCSLISLLFAVLGGSIINCDILLSFLS